MSYATIIVGVVGIAVTAVQTSSQNKKVNALAGQGLALSNLSYQEQKAFNEKMLKASTETDRLKVMADAVSNLKAAQLTQIEKNRNNQTVMVIAGGLVLLTAVYLIKKAA